jgi:phage terminase large subunit-like protein
LKLLEDEGVWVIDVPASEVTQATQRLIASVDDGTIHHLGSNEIAAALSNATLKASGDSQVWSRIKSSGDISALVAATVAVGGVRTDVDPIIRF